MPDQKTAPCKSADVARDAMTRRQFVTGTATAIGLFTIVPRHVLGGPGYTPPSEVLTHAVIGTGGQGTGGHVRPHANKEGAPPTLLAVCDADQNHLNNALKVAGKPCEGYRDWRRVLDRNDIDIIHIATPPHWHALMTIAAAQTGRDIMCEKPLTKFIREGLAVIEAVNGYGRVLQFNTHGRFSAKAKMLHKLVVNGVLGTPVTVRVSARHGYNWKIQQWSGMPSYVPQPVPDVLDYNMWLGPAPVKPYHPHRVHGSFRGYWDYDGGGLNDMGQHYLDPVQYFLGKDHTSPVEIEAYAPQPAHHDAVGMWGRVTLKYEDGTTIILESGEWGEPEAGDHAWIEGPKGKVFGGSQGLNIERTEPEGLLDLLARLPDPPPMISSLDEAVRLRKQPGNNAETGLRSVSLMHLSNTAIRLGRKLNYDPAHFRFVGDEEANRLQDVPYRAPWHLYYPEVSAKAEKS
ncbi:MAG: Gfo/Idh/MocA family oxidoreductase [Armatimonadota bacterium]|nr:Gfo/Idh/MocA family oxidoreductase [Armatimonadota bacterium]